MNLNDSKLKIGEACFHWEDESPMRRRNRLAQREYRKRKRRAARTEPKDLDCKTESPSPPPTILQNRDTKTGLPSIVQPAMPVGNLRLCLDGPDQVTPVEGSNAGHFRDDTMKTGSAYQCMEAPACVPIAKDLGFSPVPFFYGERFGDEHLDFETRAYLWPNEQGLPMSTPEACVAPQASISSLVTAAEPPIIYSSHLPACTATDIVDSIDDGVAVPYDDGMLYDPFYHIIATAASSDDSFGMIIDTCEAAEFPSRNSVVTEYYTVSPPATIYSAATQSCSRSPVLLELPGNVYASSLPCGYEKEDIWSFNTSKRFREQVLRLAEDIFTSEEGQLGTAQWDQSVSVFPASVEQSNRGMGSEGDSAVSRRSIEATESFEVLKPLHSH